jgi:NAD-dependent dihydropyrimidine dehydrogenase PreA subunit
MMKLLDISKKYGEITHKYPFEPYKVAENFRGKPAYVYDLCIGCAACGIACPSNAITVVFNDDKSKLIWEFDCGLVILLYDRRNTFTCSTSCSGSTSVSLISFIAFCPLLSNHNSSIDDRFNNINFY